MPINPRFSAPGKGNTVGSNPLGSNSVSIIRKPELIVPSLDCDTAFIDLMTRMPRTGTLWRIDELRKEWIRPLDNRVWFVNTYPLKVAVASAIHRLRGRSEPMYRITGLMVMVKTLERPEFPHFASIQTSVPQERLTQVASFIGHLAREQRTPHVEEQEQAGNP